MSAPAVGSRGSADQPEEEAKRTSSQQLVGPRIIFYWSKKPVSVILSVQSLM